MPSADPCGLLPELQKMPAALCPWEAALIMRRAGLLHCPGDPAPLPSRAPAAEGAGAWAKHRPRAPFLGAVLSSLWTQLLLLIRDETWGNYLICCLPGACAQLGQASGLCVCAMGFPHALIKK